MDFYNIDQLNDQAFEQVLTEYWDCPEAMLDDDLWDD